MATQRTNDMRFHKTKNPHLIKRHRSQSQRLTRNLAKSYHKKATSDCFTMIFIDCDDTLIPSKIHRYLFKNFGIDIFNLYQRTMLKQFQYDIIYAIEAIKEVFRTQYNEEIKIGIVSNASTNWLNATINNHSDSGYFKLLSDYFNENEIEIKSAIDETFNFLIAKFGDQNKEKVNEMMAMSLNADASQQSKWMLKYTAYSSIINKFRRKLKKKCRKIVNIGDGETELEAIKYYAQTFGVDYIALKFIKNATFNQLSYEWKYIKNNLWNIISDMDVDGIYVNNKDHNNSSDDKQFRSVVIEVGKNRKKQFKHKRNLSNISNATTESHQTLNTFYFDYVLKNDNNAYFTGAHQLTAIATYFEKWMRVYVLNKNELSQNNATINWMCAKIHSKMRGNDPYTKQMISFKKIIKDALCKNDEFRKAFDQYYNDLRSSLHHNKQRKNIEQKAKHKIHRKRSTSYKKTIASKNNIKDSSLSLMNLGKNHRRNSATSQGTMTTNSVNSTNSTPPNINYINPTKYYTDDSDFDENDLNLYLSQHTHDIDADEENSSL